MSTERVDRFKLDGGIMTTAGEPLGAIAQYVSGRDFIINLLGEIGAEEPGGARRVFGERFWTDATLPEDWLRRADPPRADVTVITDLRSEEEAARVRSLGGTVVEIINPRATDQDGRLEKGLPAGVIGVTVRNGGSLEEYRESVRHVAEVVHGDS